MVALTWPKAIPVSDMLAIEHASMVLFIMASLLY